MTNESINYYNEHREQCITYVHHRVNRGAVEGYFDLVKVQITERSKKGSIAESEIFAAEISFGDSANVELLSCDCMERYL